jgi:hypothetical protein
LKNTFVVGKMFAVKGAETVLVKNLVVATIIAFKIVIFACSSDIASGE